MGFVLKYPMPRVSNVDAVAPDNPPIVETTPSPVVNLNINDKVYEIFGHTKNSLSSSLVFPKVFSFAEQDDDETILIALRPHWFTNVGWILIAIFMFFVPVFLKYVPLLSSFSPNYQFMAIVFWYLITFIFAFEKFLSWYFDVYIITNERVIDISFENLLNKKFAEAEITKIQDVSSEVIGFTQTIFNYGRILIQTASEVNQLHFENIPNPDKIIKVIEELRHREEGQHA